MGLKPATPNLEGGQKMYAYHLGLFTLSLIS